MENAQEMTQAIMQTAMEAMKSVVQTISEAAGSTEWNNGTANEASTSVSYLKQPKLHWKAHNKHNKLLSFARQVKISSWLRDIVPVTVRASK